MAAHALLSASGAYRWTVCTKAPRFEATFPDSSSIYALEGTIAHAMGEYCLRHEVAASEIVIEDEDVPEMHDLVKVFPKHTREEMDAEIATMARHVQTYVDYVMSLPGSRFIEQRVDFSHIVPEGFGTSDAIVLNDDVADIVDLKYGKGLKVYADGPQAKLYAVGAVKDYDFIFENVKRIRLHIVQPRLDHIDVHEMTIEELREFETWIKGRAEIAYKGEGEYVAGEHCGFCRAKAVCKARADQNMKVAMEDFGEPCPSGAKLTMDQIGELLPKLAQIGKWASDVQAYALEQALAGEQVPGHKVVEGRSLRKWVDENQVAEAMRSEGLTNEQIYNMKIIGMTEAQKLLGAKSAVFELAVKAPGSPTLVPVSDKRPEMAKAAVQRDFAEPVEN
jgi:hypothetical protein